MKKLTLIAAALAFASGAAQADQILALTSDGQLHRIDSKSLSVTGSMAAKGTTELRGIDVRPATGDLYALGGQNQLYRIDLQSGSASEAAKLSQNLPGTGQAVVDFNPVADRLRLISPDGTNLRVNVETGEATVDGKLAYAKDASEAGKMPNVRAGAYTNSYAGTTATALYDIDTANGHLLLQNPPNDGVLQVVGSIASGLKNFAMDIASDGKGGNTAYLLNGFTLHTVDLASGKPTVLGEVKGLKGDVIDIAVLPAK